MFLRGEAVLRCRVCATALTAMIACVGFAPSAQATAARHYEQVSPGEKGQGDIVGDGMTTIASRSGDAVAFNSRTPFGDTVGSGVSGQTQFVARRAAGVWTTHAITPTPRPDAVQTFFAPTFLQTYSEDLASAIVWAYDLPGVTGDAPLRNNIYAEDTTTRTLQPITVSQADPLTDSDFADQVVWGISADARHVAFVSRTRLLADAVAARRNVYQWDGGVLSLAGVLPDGTIPAGGSSVVPANYRGAMSADGTRLLFKSPERGLVAQLYMRIDGSRTVWISQPEGTDQSTPTGVVMEGMTSDGRNVFFVTSSALLDEDANGGPDLYRYTESGDPANDRGNLTMISQNGDAVSNSFVGASLVGFSRDGERVYYHTINNEVKIWDHGVTRVASSFVPRTSVERNQITVTASMPGLGRVTPDGTYLAIATDASADGIHGPTGEVTNGHREMYLFSLGDGALTCISCPSGAAIADVEVTPQVTFGTPQLANLTFRPRFLSDRGQVFFSTTEALVPQDRNGVADTYEYDPVSRKLELVSSGTGSAPAMFADASASGDDVFFVTRQALVSADRDDLVDLYDARVGPPLPVPPTTEAPPCDGDACQPPPSANLPEKPLATLFADDAAASQIGRKELAVRPRVRFYGVTGTLLVRLRVPGKLAWSGRGLMSGAAERVESGPYRVRLRLSKRARANLVRRGSYATVIRLTLVEADGNEVTASTRVTYRAAAKKGR